MTSSQVAKRRTDRRLQVSHQQWSGTDCVCVCVLPLFSALNAKCVRCKACGSAVLLIAFCVILRLRPFLRLRRDMLFISSNAVRCRVFIRVLHVGFCFPLLRGSDVNLWRTQGLRIIFDILIISILYFYGNVKLIFNKGNPSCYKQVSVINRGYKLLSEGVGTV